MDFKKSDDQLLAEANALDAAYASAELHDLRTQVEYLTRALRDLHDNVQSDFLEESWSKHLSMSMNDAAEALGLYRD
jgi:CHAD domain-containing protein